MEHYYYPYEELENECKYCGVPCEKRFCSKECDKAYQSDNYDE